ncbi:MAG: taurine dioxygenase [Hyphomicrobiaceae bacterium]|jgi:taurine dioxygenase
MQVSPLNGNFGAQISGLDLSQRLDDAIRARINQAFVNNVVVCFRDQSFPRPDAMLDAVENLGEPMAPVTATYRLAGYEFIEELTNRAVDKRTGDETPLRRGGTWHTDHSNLEAPPKATVLYAIEVPAKGGNTEFVNLQLAYAALDDATLKQIRGRRAFHAYLSRRAPRKLLVRTVAEQAGSSGCWQPLVRKHPETGSKGLYLNPMRCEEIEGLGRREGDALLDYLYAHCDQPQFQYSHRWCPGDVLVWDNRSAMHQATFDFDPAKRRYLHRIMLKGEPALLAD